MNIKISNLRKTKGRNKLKFTADIEVDGIKFINCRIFQHNKEHSIGMPARELINEECEKVYMPLVQITDELKLKKFNLIALAEIKHKIKYKEYVEA